MPQGRTGGKSAFIADQTMPGMMACPGWISTEFLIPVDGMLPRGAEMAEQILQDNKPAVRRGL